MDKHLAKQLLLSGRPHTAATDRKLAEALELAKRDDELKHWLDEQRAFDQSVRSSLGSIPVPDALKSRILTSRKTIPLWQKHWPRFAAAAMAMALLSIAAVWVAQDSEGKGIAGFQNRMVGFALREYRMDIVSSDPAAIRTFLAAKGAPLNFTLPAGITALQPMGGARLSWQGTPVTMLCYRVDKNEIAYLFAVEGDLGTGQEDAAQINTVKGLNTATWKQGGTTFILAARLPADQLRQLL